MRIEKRKILVENIGMCTGGMKIKTIGIGLMINKDPIVGYASNVTFALADERARERMVLEKRFRGDIRGKLVDKGCEKRKIPMTAIKQLYASLELGSLDDLSHERQSAMTSFPHL